MYPINNCSIQLCGVNNYKPPNVYSNSDWNKWVGETHTNNEFNKQLYTLPYNPLFVLDLGCGGGGFVEQCLKDGYLAVGVEGYHRYADKRACCWKDIPLNLFVYNITYPFTIFYDNQWLQFPVVTAWEVLEHISRELIHDVIKNIYNNLEDGGVFIGTISTLKQDGHLIVEQLEWWNTLFKKYYLEYTPEILKIFKGQTIRMDCKDTSTFVCYTKKSQHE